MIHSLFGKQAYDFFFFSSISGVEEHPGATELEFSLLAWKEL
jgi:hypothetical protein